MGNQTPSERIVPEYDYSDGDDAIRVLSISGMSVDPWQENVLKDWMGYKNGVWSAPTCGLSVPRQNGKTLDTSGRIIAGMMLYGEWVIYTAHLQKTATETFLEIRGMFENSKLAKHVKEIKSALGREQVILNNGGRVMFVARTRNGGRGLHGDCLVFDEAQELTPEQQASFLPALAASQNPQTIYLGTPPDANSFGIVFRNIRDKSLNGESKSTAWTEYSVKEVGNVKDHSRWADTNPALGRRIKETTIEAECEQMDPETFARERLGYWQPITEDLIDYVIDSAEWERCVSDEQKPDGKTGYAVKFSPDGAEVFLCGAVIDNNGIARISMIDRRPTAQGIRWLSDWLNERYNKACCVVVDGRNGTDLLIDRIADVWKIKGSIMRPSAKDLISATTMLVDAVNEQKITWYRYQEDLNDSATTSTKRYINGGYGFGGSNPIPIEACSLALWGVVNCKRNPNKKMRIG